MEDLLHLVIQSIAENKPNASANPFFHILKELDTALQEEVEKEQQQANTPTKKQPVYKSIPTDVYRDGSALHVYMDVPGVTKQDIDIHVSHDNVLCVSVEKRAPVMQNNEECMLKERVFGIVRKTVQLPKTVDRSSVQAKYENGVLHISCSQKGRDDTMLRVNVD